MDGTMTTDAEQMEEEHQRVFLLHLSARIADCVRDLPAIPTLDWCDRAASCLVKLHASSAAAVLIASVEPDGRVELVEAAGVAFSPGIGSLAAEGDLRGRVSMICNLGWSIDHPASRDGSLERLIGSNWRESEIGEAIRMRGLPSPCDILAGAAAFDRESRKRRIVALAAMMQPNPPGIGDIFSVALERLARRAAIAIASCGSSWISPREKQVLELLILGHSVREIAAMLDRSTHTIHDHVKALHRKLAASSRGELIARALGHSGNSLGIEQPIIIEPRTTPGEVRSFAAM